MRLSEASIVWMSVAMFVVVLDEENAARVGATRGYHEANPHGEPAWPCMAANGQGFAETHPGRRRFLVHGGGGMKAAMRSGVWAIPAVMLTLAASLWYMEAPPRTVGDYRERAAMTVERLRSQVQTATLWVGEVEEGNATREAATVAFREAEKDAAAAASEFAGWAT
jgi:hypothetical protein